MAERTLREAGANSPSRCSLTRFPSRLHLAAPGRQQASNPAPNNPPSISTRGPCVCFSDTYVSCSSWIALRIAPRRLHPAIRSLPYGSGMARSGPRVYHCLFVSVGLLVCAAATAPLPVCLQLAWQFASAGNRAGLAAPALNIHQFSPDAPLKVLKSGGASDWEETVADWRQLGLPPRHTQPLSGRGGDRLIGWDWLVRKTRKRWKFVFFPHRIWIPCLFFCPLGMFQCLVLYVTWRLCPCCVCSCCCPSMIFFFTSLHLERELWDVDDLTLKSTFYSAHSRHIVSAPL